MSDTERLAFIGRLLHIASKFGACDDLWWTRETDPHPSKVKEV
jgi:hypothetical protein